LRLLYARVGTPHCPDCGREIEPRSATQIIGDILKEFDGQNVQILAPLVRGRTGTYEALFDKLKKSGFARVRVNGELRDLEKKIALDRYKKHTIEAVVDRLSVAAAGRTRLADSVETALRESRGLLVVAPADGKGPDRLFSEHHACPHCGTSLPEIEPRLFSFNSPYGACANCDGLGVKLEVAEDLVVTDESLSIADGALSAWADPVTTRTNRWKKSWSGYYMEILEEVCRRNKIPLDKPWRSLLPAQRKSLLHGGMDHKSPWGKNVKEFEGVIGNLERRYKESESAFVKEEIQARFMRSRLCPDCKGARLKPEALAVTVGGKSIAQATRLSVQEAHAFFNALPLSEKSQFVARQVLKEIRSRLAFLVDVGLEYVNLDRESATLAGGEAQRIHLATQIGSGLVGVLYVLDEPTIPI
ncbi:MAG TPA: excinuclease ABC subunit UvrA, partial [Elusimicrobiota bacterium]|nr:excinuclease ABC subunit UvrA [Elusimicrobiota bacterium]